ncbi:MAG: ROK family protein [Planctomycetes bacterium]|nr:ROK family protein [Planctomycetota bacterium]
MFSLLPRQYEIVEFTRRAAHVTRPLLARRLSLSLPTVSVAVRGLVDAGILSEDGYVESSGGRRARILTMNPGFVRSVGLSVNMSGVCGIVADLGGAPLAQERFEWGTEASRDTILSSLYEVTDALLAAADEPPAGIGVGITGLVQREDGVSLRFPHVEDWKEVPVAALLSERFSLPVYVDNDVNASTMAEISFGKGRGVDDFLYVFVGKGIGLGIVVDAHLYRGFSGNAGELGHVSATDGGVLCHCGNYGCLETVAGPEAIVREVQQAIAGAALSTVETAEDGTVRIGAVLQAAEAGDRLCENVVVRAAEHMGRMIANMANLFDPQVVILGGLLSGGSSRMMETIRRVFDSRVLPHIAPTVELQVSELGEVSGALGAADVVFENYFEDLRAR